MTGRWVPPDLRPSVVVFIGRLSRRTGLARLTVVVWEVRPSKHIDWKRRYGRAQEIHAARDRRLDQSRKSRPLARAQETA